MLMNNIITVSGMSVPRDKVRKIKGNFYKIGDPKVYKSGECFYLLNKERDQYYYYTLTNGKVVWDYGIEEYVIKDQCDLIYGYVDSHKKGYFSPNPKVNVWMREDSPYQRDSYRNTEIPCLNTTVAESFLKLSPQDGIYYHPDKCSKIFAKKQSYLRNNEITCYPRFSSEIYSFDQNDMAGIIKEMYGKESIEIPEIYKDLNNIIGNYTFGVEWEVSSGRVPEHSLFKHGVLPLKDGSLNGSGVEYVTIPLSGGAGVSNISQFLDYLYNCNVDDSCSLHIHVGNVLERKKDNTEKKLFLLAMYMLYYNLQREIWGIMPNYKKSFAYIAKKRGNKDHCQDLFPFTFFQNNIFHPNGKLNKSELDKEFSLLFQFVNDGHPESESSNFKSRKYINVGTAKWNIKSRYYALNLFNAFFGTSNTVEFRAHSGTINKTKTIAWLLLCIGMVKFAEENVEKIIKCRDKFSLSDIADLYRTDNNQLANFLKAYVYERKRCFSNLFMYGDNYGNEFQEDRDFVFENAGTKIV